MSPQFRLALTCRSSTWGCPTNPIEQPPVRVSTKLATLIKCNSFINHTPISISISISIFISSTTTTHLYWTDCSSIKSLLQRLTR